MEPKLERNRGNGRIHFNNEISIGHILTVLSMLLVVVAGYWDAKSEINENRAQIQANKERFETYDRIGRDARLKIEGRLDKTEANRENAAKELSSIRERMAGMEALLKTMESTQIKVFNMLEKLAKDEQAKERTGG